MVLNPSNSSNLKQLALKGLRYKDVHHTHRCRIGIQAGRRGRVVHQGRRGTHTYGNRKPGIAVSERMQARGCHRVWSE